MLKEIENARQIPGESFRRWFSDTFLDLIVWYDHDRSNIIGFQLCYRKGKEEKALTWRAGKGYTHDTVDDGEGRPGRHKMSPILVPDGAFHSENVLALFRGKAKNVENGIVEFVSQKIEEYPGNLR